MKRIPIAIFSTAVGLAASLPAAAGTLQVSIGPSRTLAELSAQARRSMIVAAPTRARRKPAAIAEDLGSNAILIQGAGSLPGANGTFFKSDVMLINYNNVAQNIAVAWFAEGADNTNAPLQFFTLNPQSVIALDDFVGQTLGKQGLGAVAIYGVDSSHNFDGTAYIDATSRIWTPLPGGSGTTSLQLPAVTYIDLLGIAPGYAFGMKQTTGFHANVGIINLDTNPHTWTVSVNGQNGTSSFTVTVQPSSLQQAPLPGGDFGDLWVSLVPDVDGTYWSAYGVSEDNVTGDGWAAHALQP